jgi:hypothetical protein
MRIEITNDEFTTIEQSMNPDEKQRIAQACFSYEDYQHKIVKTWFAHQLNLATIFCRPTQSQT